jgi:hypothetical protein
MPIKEATRRRHGANIGALICRWQPWRESGHVPP